MLCAGLITIMLAFSPTSADRTEFTEFLSQLKKEGVIPSTEGELVSFGSFTDSYANMGSVRWYSVTEAENFVISSDITWLSASTTPNGPVAGCGFVFAANSAAKGFLLSSMRMDGNVYLSGSQYGNLLSYGKNFVSNPSMEGSARMTLVVNGENVSVYINNARLLNRSSLVTQGEEVGFAVLSGTNKDFGTQCTFENTFLYTWDESE